MLVALPQKAEAATTSWKQTVEHSATVHKFARLAVEARDEAMNNPGTVLNHASLAKVFTTAKVGTYSTAISWRRQFAGAQIYAVGVRVTNITSGERSAIAAQFRRYFGSTCPICRVATNAKGQKMALRASCTGRSGYVQHQTKIPAKGKVSTTYMNSCETNWYIALIKIAGYGISAILGGFTFAGFPAAAPLATTASALVYAQTEILQTLQNNSGVKAITMVMSDAREIQNANGTCCRRIENTTYYSQ